MAVGMQVMFTEELFDLVFGEGWIDKTIGHGLPHNAAVLFGK